MTLRHVTMTYGVTFDFNEARPASSFFIGGSGERVRTRGIAGACGCSSGLARVLALLL